MMAEKAKQKAKATEPFRFEKALARDGVSFICEVKKASPSKGVIAGDFDYLAIAKDYEKAGADAISVLTEPDYFLGSIDYLAEIAEHVQTPLLRKDFVVDEYMIDEAKAESRTQQTGRRRQMHLRWHRMIQAKKRKKTGKRIFYQNLRCFRCILKRSTSFRFILKKSRRKCIRSCWLVMSRSSIRSRTAGWSKY